MWKSRNLVLVSVCLILIIAGCSPRSSQTSSQEDISKTIAKDKSAQQTDSGKGKFGGELKVALAAAPPSLDPNFSTTTQTRMIDMHIYESLVTWDYNYKVIPQLAKSWSISSDSLEYSFQLRQGVLFQNGKEMTSDDVLASFQRFQKISARKQIFDQLKEFQAVDKYTFKIIFNQPKPTFLQDLAIPLPPVFIMPKEMASVDVGKLTNSQIIGTGPYQLEEYVPDQSVTIKRFDKYVADTGTPANGLGGERTAYLDRISFKIVPEKASRLNGLQAGEFNYAEGLDASTFNQIQSSDSLKSVTLNPYFKIWAVFNTLKAPFNNLQLRQAVLMGLDEDAIMLAASGNKALYQLDHSLYYPDQVWYSDAGKTLYNQKKVEEAKSLVKNSGYNGQEVVINTNKDYDFMYQAAVALQAQLKNLGINSRLNVLDWPTSSKIANNPQTWNQFDITYTGVSLRFDPTGYNINFSSSSHFQPYASKEMDNLITQGMGMSDINQRKQYYDQMLELLYKDVPILQHGDVFQLNGSTKKLVNDKPWYMLRFWNVWLQQ
jgi:peptide/nickel transport system substrate-binding protein